MRKALIVGLDHYEHLPRLGGCVVDARSVCEVLERNHDCSVNFKTPKLLLGDSPQTAVERRALKEAVRELFASDAEIALFYFAGHGHIEATGGYLCCSDTHDGDDGLSISDIMTIANASPARNKVIILDSCHSGVAGNTPGDDTAEVQLGTTILTASEPQQYAMEGPDGGGGVFTTLLVSALEGAAAGLLGDVTPGSIYAHIDQSLGTWAQRPLFKTHVKTFVSLRTAAPPIPLAELQALAKHFPRPGHEFPLDPAYEPDRSAEQAADATIAPPDPAKVAVFRVLQRYAGVNLLRPIGSPHMYYAAMESKSCRLTPLGEHWRGLAERHII